MPGRIDSHDFDNVVLLRASAPFKSEAFYRRRNCFDKILLFNQLCKIFVVRETNQCCGSYDAVTYKAVIFLLEFINKNLGKIKSFQQFFISANLEEDTQNLLARIITLKDEKNINLQSSGYGVQFLSLICLTIFEKLLTTSRYKGNKGIFEDDDGNKYVPFLLGLDEP